MIQFQLSAEDTLAAQRLHSQSKKTLWRLYFIGNAAFAAVGAFMAFSGLAPTFRPVGIMLLWIVTFGVAMLAFSKYALTPWYVERQFRANKTVQGPISVSWNTEALTTSSQYGTATIPWAHFSKFAEDAQVFLLYTSPRQFMCIPKRALSDTEAVDLRQASNVRISQ